MIALEDTPTYHITAIENLASILATGGILSDIRLGAHPHAVIGYGHIKVRRMTELKVPCHPDTFVGDFVPFYYCPRSPMLCAVNRGATGKPIGCQNTIVHLVTSVGRLIQTGRDWAISDSNAGGKYPVFKNDIQFLNELDWAAIRATYWPDVVSQKQAEFLVRDFVPWQVICEIACFDEEAKKLVHAALSGAAHKPEVTVRRGWYY